MKKTLFAAAIVAAGATGFAQADVLHIGENGIAIGDAANLGSFDENFLFSTIGGGTSGDITEGDVDWFSFTLLEAASLQFTGILADDLAAMSIQIVGSDMTSVINSASTFTGPILNLNNQPLAAGTYYVGVSARIADAGSTLLDGSGAGSFGYDLTIGATIVPVPLAAFAGLGLLVPMGIKRRMNRRG